MFQWFEIDDGVCAQLAPLDVSVEQLADAMSELASRLHAATYELLVLLQRCDALSGWSNGFLSCAHWLSWSTGVTLGAAREKVRVVRALAGLPRISAAMACGELSYTKVRAITRIVTPAQKRSCWTWRGRVPDPRSSESCAPGVASTASKSNA